MPASVPVLAAPVLAPAVIDTLPGAPAADAGEVSFVEVLAAQLAGLAGSDRQPTEILTAAEDAPEPDGTPAAPEVPEVLDPAVLALDVSGLTPAPVQLPPQLPAQPGLGVAQPVPDQSLPVPAPDASIRSVPAPLDLSTEVSGASPPPQLSEAAKIAGVPADPDPPARQLTPLPAAQTAGGDAAPAAQASPTHGQEAEMSLTLAALGTERAENARAPAQPVRLDVAAPVTSRDFGQEVGNRIVWMATQNRQVAELRIDPPELGPVEVRLSISNDQANLSFHSPHATVRDALHASLPRLQDMLQGLGITLGQVSVGAEGFGQGSLGQGFDQGWFGGSEQALVRHASAIAEHQGGLMPVAILPLRAGVGVIDVYA
jgi:flagellar hook-length control protein FliK